MSGARSHIGAEERNEKCGTSTIIARPSNWSMKAVTRPLRAPKIDSMLLALAGDDLRQPLDAIESAHKLLGLEVRTSSELRWLRSSQSAISRLKEQLQQIQTALHFRELATRLTPRPVRIHQILRQARFEYEHAALSKGISLRVVLSDASILSEDLFLGAALRNLIGNAIKYTQPGGRVLIGCRHSRASIRIDVYDTGAGIPSEKFSQIFEAFTRLDPGRGEGLGIGLFIVRQALRILGHRLEVASTPCRGSRFSIFVARAGKENRTTTNATRGEKRERE
jgi:two-component system phosphate regulon sensor histidine kinase PhoR